MAAPGTGWNATAVAPWNGAPGALAVSGGVTLGLAALLRVFFFLVQLLSDLRQAWEAWQLARAGCRCCSCACRRRAPRCGDCGGALDRLLGGEYLCPRCDAVERQHVLDKWAELLTTPRFERLEARERHSAAVTQAWSWWSKLSADIRANRVAKTWEDWNIRGGYLRRHPWHRNRAVRQQTAQAAKAKARA